MNTTDEMVQAAVDIVENWPEESDGWNVVLRAAIEAALAIVRSF